jgi:hypothetical protein
MTPNCSTISRLDASMPTSRRPTMVTARETVSTLP